MNRRGFLKSCLALGAAPMIVRADSLMKLVPFDTGIITLDYSIVMNPIPQTFIEEELAEITRRAFVPKMIVQIYNNSPMMAAFLREKQ